jgi:ABC-type glycerol-3-phosphate transport system substrate-binding protein
MSRVRRSVLFMLVVLGVLGLMANAVLAEQKVIRYWNYGGRPAEEPLRRIIARFEEMYPDTKVELQMFGDWGDIHQKLLIALAAGDPPDLVRVKPLNLMDYAIRGSVLALDEYVERDNIDLDQLPPILVEDNCIVNGTLYGLPLYGATQGLYYNKELFAETGIEGPPETWDELVDVAQKLTDPAKRRWGYFMYDHIFGWQAMMVQRGGEFLSKDKTEPLFVSPVGIEMLQWMVDNIHSRKISPTMDILGGSFTNALAKPEILQGRAAMWGSHNGMTPTYERDGIVDFGIGIWPGYNGNHTGVDMSAANIIFKESKHPDMAWEFLKFLTFDTGSQLDWATSTGFVPVLRDALLSPPFSTDPKYVPFQKLHLDNALFVRPNFPQATEVNDAVLAEVEQALYGVKSATQALEDAAAKVREIIQAAK